MKFKFIYSILALFFVGFLFQSNSGGRAAGGDGSTMAPGDGIFCSTCHSGGNFSPQVNLSLIDPITEEMATEYEPGKTYRVVISISASNNPPGYGFQAVSLKDSDNSAINNWVSAITPNTTFRTISNGRQYFEHNRRLTTNQFEAEWMAPTENTGDVTFYLAGNAVNANGGTSGDSPTANSVTISEKMISSTNSFNQDISLNIFPNPALNDIWLNLNTELGGSFVYKVLDISGKEWISGNIATGGNNISEKLNLQRLPAGNYLINLTDGQGSLTKKIIKL